MSGLRRCSDSTATKYCVSWACPTTRSPSCARRGWFERLPASTSSPDSLRLSFLQATIEPDVLRPSLPETWIAPQPGYCAGGPAPDRMDFDRFAGWRCQSRALQLFQSGVRLSSLGDLFERAAQALADQRRSNR